MSKLAKLQLPGNIYNWIGAFLSNQTRSVVTEVLFQSLLLVTEDLSKALV